MLIEISLAQTILNKSPDAKHEIRNTEIRIK